LTIAQIGSAATGLVVGFIAAMILSVILRRLEESKPKEAIKALYNLLAYALGGGLTDYVVFDYILEQGAIAFYMIGFAVTFVPFSAISFYDWRRR
jgi:NhaP-type Na+/H+ and K+/H+ antiporter